MQKIYPPKDSIKINALYLLGEGKKLCSHMSVSDPINNVEQQKYWRRYPHGPGVDVVHKSLLASSEAQLYVLKNVLG